MSRDPDSLTEAELAEWHYAHRDELDAEQGEAVDVEVSPQLSVTMSFRLPGSEADAIRQAAQQANISLSAWIRRVLAAAATGDQDEPTATRELEAELTEVERQLDRTTQALQHLKQRAAAGTAGPSSADTADDDQ